MAMKLKGLKMPPKKAQPPKGADSDSMLSLDEDMDLAEMPSEDPEASQNDMDAEGMPGEAGPSPLDDISDEELAAEMKRRGLSMEEMEGRPADPRNAARAKRPSASAPSDEEMAEEDLMA